MRGVVRRIWHTGPPQLGPENLMTGSRHAGRTARHRRGCTYDLCRFLRSLRRDDVQPLRAQQAEAARDLPRAVAQLRLGSPSRRSARSCGAPSTSASPTSTWQTTTVRRTDRPRRTSGGSWRATSGRTGTSWFSLPRPATTCGRGRMERGARASTCCPASTSRCHGWASITWTSSTRIASIRRRRSRRPWAH